MKRFNPDEPLLFDCLSGLRHPHIAYLIDAGLTGDSRPWLAMEYVEGQNLDVYLCVHNPDLKTRLALFLKIYTAHRFSGGFQIRMDPPS